jgi:hypothetical protein
MEMKFVISRRVENDRRYKEFLEPSLQKLQVQVYQAITQEDKPEESISKKYNAILQAITERNLFADEDVLIFCEEDVHIFDNLFKEKLTLLFDTKPNISIVGVLGTSEVTDNFEWWMNDPDKLRGHILQNIGDGQKSQHLVKGPVGFYDDIVAIDKSLMVVKGKVLRDIQFDDVNCQDELYNIDFCLQALQKGFNIAVADILIYKDIMPINNSEKFEWITTKNNLINKWTGRGLQFPITTNSFNIKRNEVMEIEL